MKVVPCGTFDNQTGAITYLLEMPVPGTVDACIADARSLFGLPTRAHLKPMNGSHLTVELVCVAAPAYTDGTI